MNMYILVMLLICIASFFPWQIFLVIKIMVRLTWDDLRTEVVPLLVCIYENQLYFDLTKV
jgi:hypothetical protein